MPKKAKKIAAPPRETDALDTALGNLLAVKADLEHLSKEKTRLESQVIALMEEWGDDRYEIETDQLVAKAVIVRAERAKIDAEMLRENLTPALWNRVTTRVLDEKKLSAYVKAGDIPAAIVAEVTTIVQNRPYVRVTA